MNSTSATPKIKPSPALVQQLRKETSCSIQKAILALSTTSNDYQKALEWIHKDLTEAGQKAVSKLSGRTTSCGLVAISPLSNGLGVEAVGNIGSPLRVGMVEVNCETDFVARSQVFEKLCRDLAWSIGFYADNAATPSTGVVPMDIEALMEAPLMTEPTEKSQDGTLAPGNGDQLTSIRSAIANAVTRVGEKIMFRRAAAITSSPVPPTSDSALSVGLYAHNSTTPADAKGSSGTVAGAVLVRLKAENLKSLLLSQFQDPRGVEWRKEYRGLERALARQLVGFETIGIKALTTPGSQGGAQEGPMPLYAQEFHTYGPLAARLPRYEGLDLRNVGRSLEQWSKASGIENGTVEVLEYLKWKVGEEA
ncbi:Elongation factor Ts, mitochondrial [Serendipita sp. 411]|nr:Elongation factor Ts, mitochondrial [Serendipita sp. 411]